MLQITNMLIFVSGIILIVIGYTHNIKEECSPKIEYRFIPKNMYDDLSYNSNEKINDLWDDMTSNTSHKYNIKPYNEYDNSPI